MELYLETVNSKHYSLIKQLSKLDGILTSPIAIAATKQNPMELIEDLQDTLENNEKLFVQLVSNNYEDMAKEAALITNFNDDVIVQVPLTKDGMQVIKHSSTLDIHCCATACFNAMQGLIAAYNGAEYVEFYLNRMDDYVNGLNEIKQLKTMLDQYNLKTKILVVSFRNLSQIKDVLLLGVDAIALTMDILLSVFNNPLTRLTTGQFQSAWMNSYQTDSLIPLEEKEEDAIE